MQPFARPKHALDRSRLALVTTGGVHLPDQSRFDIDDPAGDCSYREIPTTAHDLTWTHAYYRPDEGSDLDAVFPSRPSVGWSAMVRWANCRRATSHLWEPSTTRPRW